MKPLILNLLLALVLVSSVCSQEFHADNTAVNQRDANGTTLTPENQSNDPVDLQITADIRRMVVADKSLSTLAKNIKIITQGQIVTLRGVVNTEEEKAAIQAHADHAGAKGVKNDITVKS